MWASVKDAGHECGFDWGSMGKGILVLRKPLGQNQMCQGENIRILVGPGATGDQSGKLGQVSAWTKGRASMGANEMSGWVLEVQGPLRADNEDLNQATVDLNQ